MRGPLFLRGPEIPHGIQRCPGLFGYGLSVHTQAGHFGRDSPSKALCDAGFQGENTTSGFRSSVRRTPGHQRLDIDVDVLESQLAHAPEDEVEAAHVRVKRRGIEP